MYIATIGLDRDGHSLVVEDVPLHAVVLEAAVGTLCARLGHVLCRCPWEPGWRLGQWLFGYAARRSRPCWRTRLSDAEVRAHFPDSVIHLDG